MLNIKNSLNARLYSNISFSLSGELVYTCWKQTLPLHSLKVKENNTNTQNYSLLATSHLHHKV